MFLACETAMLSLSKDRAGCVGPAGIGAWFSGGSDSRFTVEMVEGGDGAEPVPNHSDFRRFCPWTISSHTAVTYLAVAPRLTS